ncbi:unnamed protein product [marine sediment metagenome]|uniref:Homeodomain phBC6A51-type domain-containing protein n=1 Tax=marine sediment metagenome TaxID=412755 RepID=X1TRH2_9ZZZZ
MRHIPEKLTAAKLRAISFLLEDKDVKDAAKHAKVGRASLYRWMKDPLFQQRLQDSREILFFEGLDRLKGAMAKAARTLIKLLSSSDEGQQRLAAKTILDYGLKGFELKNLEERLVRLEEQLERSSSYKS